MRADYTYFTNDLVESVRYGDPDGSGPAPPTASVHYLYDAARRVTQIDHRNSLGNIMLRLGYTYLANDLPETILEEGPGGHPISGWIATTTFSYDNRRRLIWEVRDAFGGATRYNLSYVYDKGGNRIQKIDVNNGGEVNYTVDYAYDVSNKWLYGSNNNRLMKAETRDGGGNPVGTTWYYYTPAGNVRWIVSDPPAGGGMQPQYMMVGGGGTESGTAVSAVDEFPVDGVTTEWPVDGDGLDGGGGMSMLTGGGAGCATDQTKYTATRFEYAKNGETVTYVLGEQWCWDGNPANCPTSYTVTYAREFRYDGARARYMNAPLNPATMGPYNTTEKPTVWSDYDGDEIYGDFEMVSGSPVNKRSFEPGIGRTTNPLTTPVTNYYHGDLIGTTRFMSNPSGNSIEPAVYTAFGERISAPTVTDGTRYGYVGAWGYQAHTDFPYLHVGARYYDPSSGRFLQRDPMGVLGGLNVYQYAKGRATRLVDPSGLFTLGVGINFTLTLGCIHFQFELSVHLGLSTIDGHISLGGSATFGSGPAVGLGASGGLVGTLSGANDVGQLGGPAGEVGLDFGPISVGGIASPGTSDVPGYGAVQVGVGVGFGGGVRAGPTWTEVDPWY
jgi:RHS repeat-associated protein